MPDRLTDIAIAVIERVVMTACDGLRENGGGCGMPANCGGFGEGDAVMVEVA